LGCFSSPDAIADHRGAIMAGGEQRNERHISAERRVRIVELRDQGLTFREIVAETGLAYGTVWQHYQKAMRDLPAAISEAHAERAAERVGEQLRRIDMEREAVMEVLTARHVTVNQGRVVTEDGQPILDDAPVLAAVDRLVKLDDQEAKLLGLYAEQKVNLSGGLKYEIVGVSPEDLV
jgi:AcrR family transcriptional regulator